MALGEYQCLADAVLEIEAKLCSAYLAAPQGFEPRYADPESGFSTSNSGVHLI